MCLLKENKDAIVGKEESAKGGPAKELVITGSWTWGILCGIIIRTVSLTLREI